MNRYGLGLRGRPAAGPAPTAALASIDANGWSGQWASGTPPTFAPDTSPQTLAVSRQGFDASGAPATHTDTRTLTRRVRQLYPNQASDTADRVALDDYVYATDTVPGAVNNSVEVSPRPIAAWVMPDRLLVGNSIHWEMVAFHRDWRSSRQVACVVVTASDGTNTVSQTVSGTTLSTLCEDAQPVEVYAGDIDITGLGAGLVTLNAKVFPWIGAGASVLDSSASSVAREFSPRYFLKNVARFAAPPLAYVASTGNDTAGVWSTSAATASASPFATPQGAINAITTQTGVTGGVVDGCRVRVGAGTFDLVSATTARPQNVAALVIERDPAVTRAQAVVQLSTGWRARIGVTGLAAPLTEGALLIRDVTISRTANVAFVGESATQLRVMMWNVTVANGGTAGIWLANAHDYLFGVVVTGYNGQLGATVPQHRIMRGLVCDFAGNGAAEGWVTIGCRISRVRGVTYIDPAKGAIHYANQYLSPDSITAPVSIAATNAGDTITGFAVVQNLIEVTHNNGSSPALRTSSDTPAQGNTLHVIHLNNTITGYGSAGRSNIFYDNTNSAQTPFPTTTYRTHRLMRDVGNIHVQLNTKGDVFCQDPAFTGQLAFAHGVGCQGNIGQYRPNSGTFSSEMQVYPGLRSAIGGDPAAPLYDPATVWTDYKGSSGSGGTAAAGAGGGTYTLKAGSPARGKVIAAGLRYDLAGKPRAVREDSAGAYA